MPKLPAKLFHQLFWIGLAVFSFTLPVRHSITLRYSAFLVLIVATVGICVALRKRPTLPLSGSWSIYAGVALLSSTYALSPLESLGEIKVEVFYCALIFLIAATWSKNFDLLKPFALLAAAGNLVLLGTALAYVGLNPSEATIMARPSLAFAGVNSNYLVTLVPLLLYLAWSLWKTGSRSLSAAIVALVLLDIHGLILSYNRQALVALAAGVFCGGVFVLRAQFTWKRCAGFTAIMTVLAGLTVAQMTHRAGTLANVEQLAQTAVAKDVRWKLWRFSIEKIAEHPFTGGGFGRTVFYKLYPQFISDNNLLWHAHNMVLNKGIQMGIPGIVAFLLLWAALTRGFSQHLGDAAHRRAIAIAGLSTVATVFVKNMTDDFFVRDMALWFWLITGMLIGTLQRQQLDTERSA